MTVHRISVDGVSAQSLDVSRRPPRPVRHRQPDYLSKFDATTLLFDVFRADGEIIMVGPPARNLARMFRRVSGGRSAKHVRLDRCMRVHVPDDGSSRIGFEPPADAGLRGLPVAEDGSELFRGQRVLMTLNKDNSLDWIADWVRFHRDVHGATAVLLYDNGSTAYTSVEIGERLDGLGLQSVVVVDWPFKYGPQGFGGGHWDSDYCQAGMLEHARWRFLRSASSVINADVDELVLRGSGESIFEATERSRLPVLLYRGLWISGRGAEMPSRLAHAAFGYPENAESCPAKYCVVPSRLAREMQMRTHVVAGAPTIPLDGRRYAHFRAVNTGWKYRRDNDSTTDDEVLPELAADFARVQ